MGRFLVFGGSFYYALGGFHDFQTSFASAENAIAFGMEKLAADKLQWFHVLDSRLGKIVGGTPTQAYDAPNLKEV